jgi:outer membrane beta-barrel protein
MMLMVVVTAARAEVRAGSFSVTPNLGGYFFEGNENNKDAFTAGLRAGYSFTDNLAVEGFYNYVPAEYKDTPHTNNIYVCGIEGLYHFMPEGRFVPFLAIGAGAIHYSEDNTRYVPTNFAVDYGAGFKLFVTDNIALRADLRHVLPMNDRYNNLLVTFGINFAFGGEKKEVAETRVEEPVVPAAPKVEETPAPVASVVAPKVEEPVVPAVPRVEETPAPVASVVAPKVEETPAPAAAAVAPVISETKAIPEEDIRNLVNKWLASWQSGDMKNYRSCYAPDFHLKGMNLNSWISYKTNVRQKSKNISIRIENIEISMDEKDGIATAIFDQYYSSSVLKDSVKKVLSLRKINEEWKIYRETVVPLK